MPAAQLAAGRGLRLYAGHALEEAGFTRIYNVLHGFEGELDADHHRGASTGWRFEGLPWEQC